MKRGRLNFKVYHAYFRIMKLIMLNAACRRRVCHFFQAEIKLASRQKLSWTYNRGLCGFPQNNVCAFPLNWYFAVNFFKDAVSGYSYEHSRCLEWYRFSDFQARTWPPAEDGMQDCGVHVMGGLCWCDVNISSTKSPRVQLQIWNITTTVAVVKVTQTI